MILRVNIGKMSEIKFLTRFRVNIVKLESGFPRKIDGIKCFDSELESKKFVLEFNTKNRVPGTNLPCWYLVAEHAGKFLDSGA